MRLRVIASTLALALTVAYLGIHMSAAGDEQSNSKPSADAKKVYVIYSDSPSDVSGGGVVLTLLRRQKFFGIPCLVGEGVEDWGWLTGKVIRVPVSKITTIIEFESAKAWHDACNQAEDARMERPFQNS